jgi:ArsR family transcriptional regulator
MQGTVEMLKALGDENRFRIFILLGSRGMCACELLELLDIAGSTLSAHLKILRTSGLIGHKKDGRWIEYYALLEDPRVRQLYDLVRDKLLEDDTLIQQDLKKARTITREVCSIRNKGD